MTSRVDWYLLNTANFKDCYKFTCQLVEKAYKNCHSLLVKTASDADTQTLSNLLWTFRRTAFIPHQSGQLEHTILIGNTADQNPATHLNLYLPEIPDDTPCQRLLQIIPNEPTLRQQARQHYRHYQQQGYQLFTHQIK